MTWNHRIITKVHEPSKEVYYGVHEVYYNSDGNICAVTELPVDPYGESLEEIKIVLERMLRATEKPVLVYEEIEFFPWDEDSAEDET